MLKTLCNQDKPGKNDRDTFFSERIHYKNNPECDKKRTTPYQKSPNNLK